MAGASRYSTAELAELESRIATAAERALALELELFEELRQAVLASSETVAGTAAALAELDLVRRARRRWPPSSAMSGPWSTTATPS